MKSVTPSGTDPVDGARELGPAIKAAADEIERIPGPLPSQLHTELIRRILPPRLVDGYEMEPWVYLPAIQELSRHDCSVGWNMLVANSAALIAPFILLEVAETTLADPRAVVMVARRPPNDTKAIAAPGGCSVNRHHRPAPPRRRPRRRRCSAKAATIAALLLGGATPGVAASVDDLLHAYPNALAEFDGANLIWRDGTRMAVDDGRLGKSGEDQLRSGSILDQLRMVYPAGAPFDPVPQEDPGRVRNRAFFYKMYGDCRTGEVAPTLVPVVWLPNTWGHVVRITSTNGVDRRLAEVSRELDALPAEDKKYLYPPAGTYFCRAVADVGQTSMHAWGAAIDINTRLADYWLWRRGSGDPPPYVNRIPSDIVAVFERHGFIWGGRWAHYDTMHFEYRPELLGYRPPNN